MTQGETPNSRLQSVYDRFQCAAQTRNTEIDHVAWTHIIIILVIFLLGGFSGRFGGYGYGFGHVRHRAHRPHPDYPGRAASHGQALIF